MAQKNGPPGKSYTRKKIQNFSYGLNDGIGKGYSSQVYRGRNDTTDEPVAVKVIDLKMLKCEINRTLLASEIEILKSMKNIPHVLTLHEVYTTKNNTYIITELCETDLSSRIKKGLTESEAFTFMNQIIEGYSFIYQRDLIHRDLKPANLLITKNNDIKIADFGFGVKAEEVIKPSKYNVGSPLYMAPESLKRNQYSFKSDIWALGIIYFEMLTGDTPWRAKNEKQLLKKIEGEKIVDILTKHKFNSVTKEFLTKALSQDKSGRLGPEELIKFNFTSKMQDFGAVLGEKQMNTMMKIQKFQSIINQAASPKNMIGRSIQKRLFQHQKSQKKLPQKTLNNTNTLQNMSIKNIQNQCKTYQALPSLPSLSSPSHPTTTTPNTTPNTTTNTTTNTNTTTQTISKQDKKYVSKLLIAQVHFCRFLFKLLGRVKESMGGGIFYTNGLGGGLFTSFTRIIGYKVAKLRMLDQENYLDIQVEKYQEYKKTTDYRKLIKIAKDYYDRYSSQLSNYWQPSLPPNYSSCISQVTTCIEQLLHSLTQAHQSLPSPSSSLPSCSPSSQSQSHIQHQFLSQYSKDVIILDYLITCKQLLEMIEKQIRNTGRQNYEKFAKKSRIQEIVEGATSQIGMELFCKIVQRGRIVVNARRD